MSKTLEFFFDFGSPASYLAWTQLPRITGQTGAQVRWRPMLLGAVLKASGNPPPIAVPAKRRFMLQDLARFAERYGVPLVFNPCFPFDTMTLMRGAVAYLDSAAFAPYVAAIFDAMWVQKKALSDPAVVVEVLEAAGFDVAEFELLVADEKVKQQLKANTEEAVERGVFGAPSFFVGDTLYFGQDRLDFVAEALAQP
ncbi:2-hydroxychromene-2-carboxylate isomerase [Pseudomonas benzenivorans]|uniref:2-hydroxychromene-2-carboxylate isomerase n=1 Tax=Pseudomonas benzenivorans TaxID=556533 RepID=A0ABY5HCL0_9PSED|nr:2-hydroxychromene-2-carboxylate isomerase [Pseudomonas benzenivorans]UTW09577.1 2-hydroxychromene-2-carboxylate isomerase [Pseudomonas benzenivorans]